VDDRSKQAVDLLIDGGVVITVDWERRIYNPGYVAIRNGTIVGVGSAPSCPFEADDTIDASGAIVMPGLVNAHNHLDQSVYRSCFDTERKPRYVMFEMAKGLNQERARRAAALSLLELLRYGVTTTQENHWTHFDIHSTDGVCDAVVESGMRAVVSRGLNDLEKYRPPEFCEDAGEVLKDLDRLEEKYDSDRIQITSEPCTILRCHPETVQAMREWAQKRDKIWHIHLAQNDAEMREAQETVGMGSVQFAEKLGVLGPDMYAIHCSGLLDEEVELLGAHGVRVAHCPTPVMRGGGRVPPIWKLEELGAKVAIGTDGSISNNGQNIWEAMKCAVYMQRVKFSDRFLGTAEQALEMATIKAAEALGLGDRIGSLEEGKAADVAVFSADQLHLAPGAMLISNMVYSGCDMRADVVLVGGKRILCDGCSTSEATQPCGCALRRCTGIQAAKRFRLSSTHSCEHGCVRALAPPSGRISRDCADRLHWFPRKQKEEACGIDLSHLGCRQWARLLC